MKTLRRAAIPLVVSTLVLGLGAVPSSAQDPDDFDFAISYSCEDLDSVIVTFTLTNNSDYGIEIYNAHLEPSYEALEFDPGDVDPGGSTSVTFDSGANPLSTVYEVDILMYIEPTGAEGRLDYEIPADYECQEVPPISAVVTSTTAAAAATTIRPTFTG